MRERSTWTAPRRSAASWLFGMVTAGTAVFASDLPPPSLTDLSAEITEPVLFIHATPGQGGDADREVLRGGQRPEGVLAAPAAHRRVRRGAAEYERRIVGFFDRNLLGGSA